ncbi:HIT domain-containing protein [uncultured Halopseudomonas sp.]|uniref:HIT domain-containing protein n=1 Tax=uncultured Halopseudomonas sp. TaxID=2901193 RepID=UPI0030EEC8A2|tara:strand:- start:34680 stop:35111 length:432 start_codon:yes stop_codon:yes gene_type:complete
MFKLDQRLANDCVQLGDFPLCRLLLMNDSQYPWCILVPRVNDVTEIFELSERDQQRLSAESSLLSQLLSKTFSADKMNVAALGNVVSQLHIHHVVRYSNDAAWPAPVWGRLPVKPCTVDEMQARLSQLKRMLPPDFEFAEQSL